MSKFERADTGPFKDAWDKKILPFLESIPDDEAGLLSYAVSHPDAALFISTATGMASAEHRNCKLLPIPGEYMTGYVTFGIQKDSPYGELLDYFLRKLTEGGHVAKLQLKYLASTHLNCKGNNKGQAIGLETALPAIIIMIAGIIIGAIFFIIEMFFKVFKWK